MSQQSFLATNGTGGNITFSIDSFSEDEIKVYVDGVLKATGSSNDYTIPNYTTTGGTVTWVGTAPTSSNKIRIVRQTDVLNNGNTAVEGKATYTAGSSVKAADLNNNTKQALRAIQEQQDQKIQTYDIEADSIDGTLIADDVINSEHYVHGSIDNIHVASDATIAGTKISPNFGSQNITTTGNIAVQEVTITSAAPVINFVDNGDNPDYRIVTNSGQFKVQDTTASNADRLIIQQTNTRVKNNLLADSGVSVTGNINGTGDLILTADAPKIQLIDNNADDDFQISNFSGNFIIKDITNSVDRFTIASDGTTTVANNLNVGAGLDLTGNLVATGTEHKFTSGTSGDCSLIIEADTDNNNEDDNPKLIFKQDGGNETGGVYLGNNHLNIASGIGSGGGIRFRTRSSSVGLDDTLIRMTISNTGQVDFEGNVDCNAGLDVTGGNITGVLGSSVTATTQSAGDNSTKIATTAYVDNASGTTLTTEEVQDIVGGMVSGNTETNIAVTYDDTNGKLNFASTDTDTNTQLTNEQVQDIVGAMVSGNTETNIAVTYDDTNGKLNFASTDTNTVYANSDVDTHLNQSSASSNEVLSWNGSDYAWVAQSGGSSFNGGTITSGLTISNTTPTLTFDETTGSSTYDDYSITVTGSTSNQLKIIRTPSGGSSVTRFTVTSSVTQAYMTFSTSGDLKVGDNFLPYNDDNSNIGSGSKRFDNIYATNTTISNSDERLKQDIQALTTAEKAVATTLKGLIKTFKYKSAVAAKGDKARIHCGVIAQEVKAAFEAQGLKAEDYALFCYDEWDDIPEVKDDEGTVLEPAISAGNRYSIRYSELLAFIISAL